MPQPARERVQTILAEAARAGRSQQSAEELLPLLYDELRALARSRLARERAGATLQATALVHEAWLRLVGTSDPGWSGRAHFFGAAALAMQRILVEHARGRGRLKRGAGLERVQLDEVPEVGAQSGEQLLALDEALARLQRIDGRKAEVVRLRYFAGLTHEEIAAALDLAPATIKSDWSYARAWLHRELAGAGGARAQPRGE